ncbi:MAG: glycoside hydrolase family 65 protein [Clostridia bacterium]|nr:glycoside hydrolase family 65 protein [Clostridia bacterium]
MSKWKLTGEGFSRGQIVTDGNRFLCANGYMGLRGVFEEADSSLFPAITLAGVYDQYQDRWREPVNAPHCLYAKMSFNGKTLAVGEAAFVSHTAGVDYGDGFYYRETDFGPVVLRSERFVSMAETHLLCDRLTITCAEDGELELCTGVSTDIWDINGPHLFDFSFRQGETLLAQAVTGQKGIRVASAQCVQANVEMQERYVQNESGVFRVLCRQVVKGETLQVDLFGAVYTSLDGVDPAEDAQSLCARMKQQGFDTCFEAHKAAWERINRLSEITLEGNDAAALALHASQYHLNSIAPRHANNLSIPARGLSGQTYKGAIFWDSEIFFFPMFVHTQPEVARSLLRYRIETLPGAIKKAAEYGFRGAFYAWESQEGGEEGCTNFNVVDVFTHRPVRTYFRDKQIHISGDIAYALRSYYEITGDRSLLEEGGAEVILQCARFYISRAWCHADKDAVDFADVIGPDEYHERVTNNAFTNRMIRHTMDSALLMQDIFADKPAWFAALLEKLDYHRDWQLLQTLAARIAQPETKGPVIAQFDGFFDLEDCSLDTVRSRLCNPREYWGGDHGVAGTTQIIKQADVIAMMALFPQDFTDDAVAANWDYYEPRTEHGSSLSACMYALTACHIGKPELAWELFMRTASIDMKGGGKEWAGEIYIGGTHPASNGGAWMIAALGFAGLQMKNGQPTINPHLPEQIAKLSFPIVADGKRLRVTVTRDGGVIDSDF